MRANKSNKLYLQQIFVTKAHVFIAGNDDMIINRNAELPANIRDPFSEANISF